MTPDQITEARAMVAKYDCHNPMRTADVHNDLCICARCLRDALTAALDEIERLRGALECIANAWTARGYGDAVNAIEATKDIAKGALKGGDT